LPSKVLYDTTDAKMKLHTPSKAWFIASLIITVIAVLGALSPIPYITTYGIWIAILAYIVLATRSLA
jgi:hypothetical protein